MKITSYTILTQPTPVHLEREVRKFISVGWQPVGGPVQSVYSDWSQAMVFYQEEEEAK